ncbi:CoB--CoM heterodisulfide reductase [Candidatus Vecturithrix granuli]|uniref:CoB--CoM heterodisulfide reductase n=1 Tax=Vecturithrix granuli TaxID=1499967 RepID=A0A081BX82_VECG1|nr:CoB--CoM heterodisulfide reductase [Candidatus Vecturithrix granuli]
MHIDKYAQTIFEWKFTPMATYICPTYKVTKNESNAPRGLAFLLSLITGKQQRKIDEVVAERMYQCNSCYLCTSCGYDETDPALLFIAARADIVEACLAPACIGAHKEKLLKQTWKPEAGKQKADIGVVVDPFIATTFPDELRANLQLLEKAGIEHEIVNCEQGSGAQLFELGFWDLAKSIAEQNIQMITSGGYKTLLFFSHYDFKAFTAWYAELGLQIPDVKAVPFPAYLLELVRSGKLTFQNKKERSVTYHDAAHFVRPQSSFLEIGALLEAVPEICYKPMWKSGRLAYSDAGDFLPFTYPEIAAGINAQLLGEVKQTGAETVLTSCFYALHNLRQASQPGDPKISDLGTFLADCL